jgi:hypothetical protein
MSSTDKEMEEIKKELDELSDSINEKFENAIKDGMKFESKIPPELLKKKYLKYKSKYLALKQKL